LVQPYAAEEEISAVIDQYGNMIRRICFLYLKNPQDVEDVFQEVFIKVFLTNQTFQNEQHRKAWLCRVTYNKCKDFKRSFWNRRVQTYEEVEIPYESQEERNILEDVMALPAKYKWVIYLHFYEGYTIPEIGDITRQNTSTVYSQLRRAKEKLRKEMGG
jgi:RNA polymerase sigma-70 factor (ECF subfamily)